jgi:hypothetical protein
MNHGLMFSLQSDVIEFVKWFTNSISFPSAHETITAGPKILTASTGCSVFCSTGPTSNLLTTGECLLQILHLLILLWLVNFIGKWAEGNDMLFVNHLTNSITSDCNENMFLRPRRFFVLPVIACRVIINNSQLNYFEKICTKTVISRMKKKNKEKTEVCLTI